MMERAEQMDRLVQALDRETGQLAELIDARRAAEAANDRAAATALERQIEARRSYVGFLREQFERRLN